MIKSAENKVCGVREELLIRPAVMEDAEALAAIYAPYVEQTAITFEYEVPSTEEFRGRMINTMKSYPYLVAQMGREVLGYAYASAFKTRAAYDWSVEMTIYLMQDAVGKGIGTELYMTLEDRLRKRNFLNANACIAYPNPESIAFHEKLGYREVAHFHQCGYKLGRWYDMIWMEKMLNEHPKKPKAVKTWETEESIKPIEQ